jgi:hypothetical protein
MLKKSIHGFFQRIFSARLVAAHVRDGLCESTTELVVRVGVSCPKRETLSYSAFPFRKSHDDISCAI